MAIVPTREQLEELTGSTSDDPIVMLNLLRFKDEADGIDAGISGAEAYGRYAAAAAPFLERAGGRLLIATAAQQTFIGPTEREWDLALMVEYPSRKTFLQMATDPDYLEIHQHRDAALEDSRLIVCEQVSMVG